MQFMNKTDIYQKRRIALAKKIRTNTGGGVAVIQQHQSYLAIAIVNFLIVTTVIFSTSADLKNQARR